MCTLSLHQFLQQGQLQVRNTLQLWGKADILWKLNVAKRNSGQVNLAELLASSQPIWGGTGKLIVADHL